MDVSLDFNAFPGRIMQLLMKGKYSKSLDNLAEELKHYAETGEAHPRKVTTMERALAQGKVVAEGA